MMRSPTTNASPAAKTCNALQLVLMVWNSSSMSAVAKAHVTAVRLNQSTSRRRRSVSRSHAVYRARTTVGRKTRPLAVRFVHAPTAARRKTLVPIWPVTMRSVLYSNTMPTVARRASATRRALFVFAPISACMATS